MRTKVKIKSIIITLRDIGSSSYMKNKYAISINDAIILALKAFKISGILAYFQIPL